jgi:hypothetical protein
MPSNKLCSYDFKTYPTAIWFLNPSKVKIRKETHSLMKPNHTLCPRWFWKHEAQPTLACKCFVYEKKKRTNLIYKVMVNNLSSISCQWINNALMILKHTSQLCVLSPLKVEIRKETHLVMKPNHTLCPRWFWKHEAQPTLVSKSYCLREEE